MKAHCTCKLVSNFSLIDSFTNPLRFAAIHIQEGARLWKSMPEHAQHFNVKLNHSAHAWKYWEQDSTSLVVQIESRITFSEGNNQTKVFTIDPNFDFTKNEQDLLAEIVDILDE